jgi:hypothetical protein
MTSGVWRSSVSAAGGLLVFASASAVAQQPGRCNPERILAEIDSNHAVPSFRGCRPDSIRAALRSRDYGLTVDNRHSSNSIPAGGIVSQRVEASTVHVDLSTGPYDQPNLGGQEEGHGHGDVLGGVAGEVAKGVIGAILNHPPAAPEVPAAEPPPPPQYQPPPPQYEPPPPQYQPPPAPPVVAPPVVAAPPPPPAVKPPPPHHDVTVAQAQPPSPPPKVQPHKIDAAPDNPPPVAQLPPEQTSPRPVTPPAAQPSVEVKPTALQGGTGQKASWWATLLDDVSASPLLAAAIAAAVALAAAAALAKIFWPRATCSIERGSFALRPLPLRSAWPGLHVDTVLGSAAFSIPRPLPIRRVTDVEPSPA